jgi:hypothetical protein
MGGFTRGIGTHAERFGHRWNGEGIDEWFQAVYAQGTMDWDFLELQPWMVHAGRLMIVNRTGRLLQGESLEGANLGRGQGCGASASFEE